MIDGVDPGASSAADVDGTIGPPRDRQAKRDVSSALDLRSVRWSRLRDESGAQRGPVEYAFVPHSDGVTYIVLRTALRGGGDGRRTGGEAGRDVPTGDTDGGAGEADAGRGENGVGEMERPVLVFTPSEWDAFLAGARDGEFDRPPD